MFVNDCSSGLAYARERARQLQAQAAAERIRSAAAPRRTAALLLRRAADRLDPAPLAGASAPAARAVATIALVGNTSRP